MAVRGRGRMDGVEVAGRVDGRTARAERTRAAIVEAHLALICEGDLRPTGERIAERAGISLRTLWTNFKDMETLFEASGAEVLRQQDAAHRPISPGLPLAKRVDAYCRQRARLLQLIAPSARAAQMREPVSEQLHRNRLKHIDRVRDEVEQLFAAELAAGRPGPGAVAQRPGGGEHVAGLVDAARRPGAGRGPGPRGDGPYGGRPAGRRRGRLTPSGRFPARGVASPLSNAVTNR